MSTFITLGNAYQPFPRLLSFIEQIVEVLPTPICIQHGYTPLPTTLSSLITHHTIDRETFNQYMEHSSVIITHAGIGSILSAINFKKKAFVLPRIQALGEHINDHQVETAHAFNALFLINHIQSPSDIVTNLANTSLLKSPNLDQTLVNYITSYFDSMLR